MKKVSFPREILPLAAVGSMLVHFFLQSLGAVHRARDRALARRRGRTSPLLPIALLALLLLTGALGILLCAINVYLRDTQHFLELALLGVVLGHADRLRVHDRSTAGPAAGSSTSWLANPVTPIVLIFQRAIYAKLDNSEDPGGSARSPDPSALAVWDVPRCTSAYSFVVGLIVLRDRDRACSVASEANFAEEL